MEPNCDCGVVPNVDPPKPPKPPDIVVEGPPNANGAPNPVAERSKKFLLIWFRISQKVIAMSDRQNEKLEFILRNAIPKWKSKSQVRDCKNFGIPKSELSFTSLTYVRELTDIFISNK